MKLAFFISILFLISCSTSQQTTASIDSNLAPIPLDKITSTENGVASPLATPASASATSTQQDQKFSNLTCEALIEKSKDETAPLKGLAAIRAKRNGCKGFSFDIKKLSDFERRLYAEQLQDLDPNPIITTPSLSLGELKTLIKTAKTSTEKAKAYKQLRSKQKSLGQRNEFLKTTADFYNWSKAELKKNNTNPENRTNYYEAALLFAKTFWTEGRIERAESILSDALRTLKGVTSVAEIYFITGRMAEEKQETDKAIQMYDLALEDIKTYKPKSLSFNQDRILWLKAWIQYKEKKWAEAEKSFAELTESTPELNEKSRAQFYRARALNQLDKKSEATALLEKITQTDFYGYYGLVAYHELGRKLPALSKIKYEKKFSFDLNLSFLKPIEKNIFVDLIRYGEVDIAEKAVSLLSRNPEQQINLGIYLANKGERYLPLFAGFGKLDNNSRIEVLVNYGHLLYPQPHSAKVSEMASKTSLPPSLIYAIMKQESAFNEKTRSHADAMGLMQMIPRLAKHLSKKFAVNFKANEDLYKPEINITLGSYELMEQVKKQDGQLTYVAAAYNAGPGALSNWLKTRNRNNLLEFIEEIPYEETRTYVKLIARNMLFYDRISKRDDEHPFPSQFLVLNDSKKDVLVDNK